MKDKKKLSYAWTKTFYTKIVGFLCDFALPICHRLFEKIKQKNLCLLFSVRAVFYTEKASLLF